MKTQSFKESDIDFEFSGHWVVKKYDDHAYFKLLSGHGLKGVDFIGIYKNERLYLIEVKNYHKRSYSPVDPDLADIEGEEPVLGMQIHSKMEDSLSLIRIVNKYLHTRWWFKISSYIRLIFKRERIQKDWHFWTRVGELSKQAENVYPILWIETSPKLFERTGLTSADTLVAIKNEYAKRKSLPTMPLQITSIDLHSEHEILNDFGATFRQA